MSAVRIPVVSVSVALLLTTACLSQREARVSGALSARDRSKADALAHFSQGLLAEWSWPASEPEQPLSEYRTGVALDPESDDLICKEASALMNLGQCEEALAALREAVKKMPDSAIVHFGLGRVFVFLNRFSESAESFLKAAELSRDSMSDRVNCLLMAIMAFNNSGNVERICDVLCMIDEITSGSFVDSDFYRSHKFLPGDGMPVTPHMIAVSIASEYAAEYALDGRVDNVAAMVSFFLGHSQDPIERELFLSNLAASIFKTGKQPEFAAELYRLASKENPFSLATASYSRAILAVENNLKSPGYVTEDMMLRALEKNQSDKALRTLLAVYYFTNGKYKEASHHSEFLWIWFKLSSVIYQPKEAWYLLLGSIRDHLGDKDGAEEIFRDGIEVHPESSVMLNYLAYMMAERGRNLDESEAFVRRALELNPDNSSYLDTLGWVYYMRGDYTNALHWLERADCISKDSVISEHIGDVMFKLGRTNEAATAWIVSYRLDETQTNIVEKLRACGMTPSALDSEKLEDDSIPVTEANIVTPCGDPELNKMQPE